MLIVALSLSGSLSTRADEPQDPEQQKALLMQRFVVSATRIERNPWRYAATEGFEVLTRASEHDTKWWMDALRRGMWVEDTVMPQE
ncbi:MAG TPA: hypothetical protein VFE25_00120, partial [Opitutaceae bacterium]|nr:hypothetical protein [Opitutaceae bacterium]